MQIAVIEMPAEQVYRVSLDDQKIEGHIVKTLADNWQVWRYSKKHNRLVATSPVYRSKEAAAMRLLIFHFEEERQQIRRRTQRTEY